MPLSSDSSDDDYIDLTKDSFTENSNIHASNIVNQPEILPQTPSNNLSSVKPEQPNLPDAPDEFDQLFSRQDLEKFDEAAKEIEQIVQNMPMDQEMEIIFKRIVKERQWHSSRSEKPRISEKSPRTSKPRFIFGQAPYDILVDGLLIQLLPHQVAGLHFMLRQEFGEMKGGILADDMGLGKTVQTLALILYNPPGSPSTSPRSNTSKTSLIVCPVSLLSQWQKEIHTKTKLSCFIHHGQHKKAKTPKELMQYDVVLSSYQTIANEQEQPLHKFGNQVIAKKPYGPIFHTKFHRIVLDEAHTIRNWKSKQAVAIRQLQATHRWCLTGTPLHNSVDDFYSLLLFLRIPFWSDYHTFRTRITDLVSGKKATDAEAMDRGVQRLQFLLKACLLRRNKSSTDSEGNPLVILPKREVVLKKVQLRSNAQEPELEERIYDVIYQGGRDRFKVYLDNGSYGEILVLLLRLRQLCDHPLLLAQVFWRAIEKGKTDRLAAEEIFSSPNAGQIILRIIFGDARIRDQDSNNMQNGETEQAKAKQYFSPQTLMRLLDRGRELLTEECSICMDVLVSPQITSCGHLFCLECTRLLFENDDTTCPQCRQDIQLDQCVDGKVFFQNSEKSIEFVQEERPLSETEKINKDLVEYMRKGYQGFKRKRGVPGSLKLNLVTETIQEFQLQDPDVKILIFSNFLEMLDIIELELDQRDIVYARYDGTMNQTQRQDALTRFEEEAKCKILLMSLKAGNVGLNLTHASRVILVDNWWSPMAEEQAIDRCHRTGQQKDVKAVRLALEGTIEERILQVQDSKRELAKGALGEGQFKLGRLTTEELRYLFKDDRRQMRLNNLGVLVNDLARVATAMGEEVFGRGE